MNFVKAFRYLTSANPTRAESNASNRNFGKSNLMKISPVKFLLAFTLICAFSVLSSAQDSEIQEKYPSDRKLKIIERPVPRLTEEQKQLNICAQGIVTLRIEFLSIGEIGEITPIGKYLLPYGLTENAIEAAKKIKFEPAIKDGMATTIIMPVQYTFKWGWIKSSKKSDKSSENTKKDKSQQP